ncbi:hypothetical protein U4N45_22245, partial [Klebsiella pneumoniae]|nr:hypothetical protein [Klebsiella pneumoniae]
LLENSLSAKVSCWLIRLLILGSGYNTMISHLGLIRTFPYQGIKESLSLSTIAKQWRLAREGEA